MPSNFIEDKPQFNKEDKVEVRLSGKKGIIKEISYYADGYYIGFCYKVKHRLLNKWYMEYELKKC